MGKDWLGMAWRGKARQGEGNKMNLEEIATRLDRIEALLMQRLISPPLLEPRVSAAEMLSDTRFDRMCQNDLAEAKARKAARMERRQSK